jgi:hypothetical protein
MSTDRETARIVRSWLEEGRTSLPDWVRNDVLDRLPATPQRRSRWPARRFTDMNSLTKLLVATAAVVAVAVLGISLLPRPGAGPGNSQPTSSASPSAAPSDSPQAVARRLLANGPIDPGTYLLSDGRSSIRVTIPAGWDAVAQGMDIRKHRDQPDEVMFNLWTPDINVFADACATGNPPPPTGPTAADLLAALRGTQNVTISDPVETTIGGLVGMRLVVGVPADLDIASCTNGTVLVWSGAVDGNWLALGDDMQGRPGTPVSIVEPESGRFVFGTGSGAEATEADLAERDAIVSSIEFVP